MKKIVLTALIAFTVGFSINSIAFSEDIDDVVKIGVVDVAAVIKDSSQMKLIQKEQELKKAELVKWLSTVKTDIQKQSTDENKIKLAKKYDEQLIKKQEANKNDYIKKVTALDNQITKAIEEAAKTKGYTVVFQKGAILYGGDNLTKDVSKIVK